MRGSCCPGSLLASNTPGIDVVRMAMLPVRATTVPAAGTPAFAPLGLAAGDAPLLICGCDGDGFAAAELEPFIDPPEEDLAEGLALPEGEGLAAGAASGLVFDATSLSEAESPTSSA